MFCLQEALEKVVVSFLVVFALIGEDGFLTILEVGFNFGMDVLAADVEAVGLVDGGLGKG